MNVLGIDCATSEMKLGFQFGQDRLVKSSVAAEQSHSSQIMRGIGSLLESANRQAAEVNAIVVCTGPGSFTGLRIGIACAKGMAVALKIPVVGVNLFEVAAYKLAGEDGVVKVLIPFKKDSYFVAKVEKGRADLLKLAAVEVSDLQKHVNGSLMAVVGGNLQFKLGGESRLLDSSRTNYDATELIYLGIEKLNRSEYADITGLEPLYVQKSQAEIRFEERRSRKN